MRHLNDNLNELEILSKPLPPNFKTLSYFGKLKLAPLIYKKRKILNGRLNTPKAILDNELCIFAPGLHMEFFRCTDIGKMADWIKSTPNPQLEVYLTGEVPMISLRVGKNMSKLLHNYSVTLKITDIYGEEIMITNIVTDNIQNRNYD